MKIPKKTFCQVSRNTFFPCDLWSKQLLVATQALNETDRHSSVGFVDSLT